MCARPPDCSFNTRHDGHKSNLGTPDNFDLTRVVQRAFGGEAIGDVIVALLHTRCFTLAASSPTVSDVRTKKQAEVKDRRHGTRRTERTARKFVWLSG